MRAWAVVCSLAVSVSPGCRGAPNADADGRGSAPRASDDGSPDLPPTVPDLPEAAPEPALEPEPPVQPPGPGAAIEDERNTIAVFEAAAPATVFVTQSKVFRNRFTMRVDETPAGTGTGFIWDARGHVVTNYHVVAGGDSFSVTLLDGRVVPARFIGGDPNRDIAVLELLEAADDPTPRGASAQPDRGVDYDDLTPIHLPAEDHELVVGQKALAIGNPFGLDHTLTVGVISALEREVVGFGGVTIRNMIQTDASINPGNSGGPLLDSAGQLIGMNTMIFSKSGSSAGIGFAVPIETIRRLVPQILEYGHPRRAALGIEVVSDRLAARNQVHGVVIEKVAPGGPAAAAGLQGLRWVGRENHRLIREHHGARCHHRPTGSWMLAERRRRPGPDDPRARRRSARRGRGRPPTGAGARPVCAALVRRWRSSRTERSIPTRCRPPSSATAPKPPPASGDR